MSRLGLGGFSCGIRSRVCIRSRNWQRETEYCIVLLCAHYKATVNLWGSVTCDERLWLRSLAVMVALIQFLKTLCFEF